MSPKPPEELKTDDETVTLSIDGKEVIANKDELLISAAQRAGVFIPRFCYHDRLEPVGMCRMCLVEIEGVKGLPPACTTPVADGMVVNFQKDNVEKVGEGVLEFLLINHPLDCPVCDRGGECPLQDQALSFGPGESRFIEEKRHWEKPIKISDHVMLDRERCIQCSRCTRFADDIAGDPLITFVERGDRTEVNTFPDDPFVSHFSGNIVQICPVGALTAKPYRFKARPWDLASVETTCMGCSVGCKGVAQTSRNEMVRLLGVDSEPINQGWLCDNGRYGFDFMNSKERVRSPYVFDGQTRTETNLNNALDIASQKISEAVKEFGPESVAFLGGAHGTNEDAYSIARLAKGTIGTPLVDSQMGNSLPTDVIFAAKRARISDIDNAQAVITLGTDIKETLPVLFLRLRQAVKKNSVPLIDVNSVITSTTKLSTSQIDLVPGNEFKCIQEIVDAINQLEIRSSSNGKIILIAGDINNAQDGSTFTELVQEILKLENVELLPAIATANIAGAYEMGLAPGLLPGRVDQDSVSEFGQWIRTPQTTIEQGQNITASILSKARDGEVKVLVLCGANPIAHFSDKTLATTALQNCETIIALDCFMNESSKYANIFFPTTVANEKDGTITNIEGRVQRVVQVVAPQGNVFDDWKIASLIGERLDDLSSCEIVSDVTNEIARVAPSFAHLTTGVLYRARDGAIVPVDENKDVLVSSSAPAVDTPSWEPIASRAFEDEDPFVELNREEHHPSANMIFAPMITSAFERETAHTHHLDQYSLRLVFIDTFHRSSTLKNTSATLEPVSKMRSSDVVRINPKDLDSIVIRDDNLVTFRNDIGSIELHVQPDETVMRGLCVATNYHGHPLRDLVSTALPVTDLRIEGK